MASAAPAVDPGLASIESTAANALATAMSSDPAPPASSPDPTPPPAPPAAAAPATPSTEATPPAAPPQAPPAGQATTAPTTIDISALSPEARRFLEMRGGDINQALAAGLDYNNRLAAAARGEAPAPGAPPPPTPGAAPAAAPPAALASPQAPPAAAPVAPADPAVIERELEQLLGSDQECIRLAQAFRSDVETLQALDTKYGGLEKLEAEIRYHERRLQDADVKEDEVATANLKETVRELKEVRAERRDIVRSARELDAAYNTRAGSYQQRLNGRYEASRAKAESDARVERQAQDLSVSWTPAIQRAATANNISPELIPKFEELARQAALANIELGFAVEDLPEFLNRQAKALAEVVDIGHRVKAAEFGDAARRRAENPGPAAEASVATAQVPQTGDLNEVYKLTRLRLEGKL